jgi:hypothetical protein
LTRAGLAWPVMLYASILDSLQDLSSLAFALIAFTVLFLLLEGFDRV